ncbi:ABC transporter ATP-binding protein [Sporomusa sp. KB1]|jgi:peptide/nickel transport system ATP-binding protein/oligopeptide transport system ATP-binding protein|uniref:oligopeptide/dipeptide ABC transporter ATP-binding protein n=1 Tax=Sporomusa sp. KB1 TaxID=943346 RepID=UPI0011AD3651|nr:ABC transporter ATP-binding protein [Sporomusa sp. KB1]TWH51661.1 peptide/nickel transport system ATP-binding protein/oligopeptide transport system ATP-binding protein [Sporomusa sp. KB1]TWH52240.1 peptide/nickel transport system ATP-binding protein/oligopeptide transport system ATP-binding protein [Sporomusa sp. KB1]
MGESVNLFEITNLYKCYNNKAKPRVYAVYNTNLTIKKGEILGLVGESGCGKSTLGKMLLKLEQPSRGRIIFNQQDITDYSFNQMRKIRNSMQMIFQGSANAFNPYFTVEQIISEPLNNYSQESTEKKREKIIAMLEKVGLDQTYLTRYGHEMSGGQRQRVGIARALILNPEFVVCDEAVSSIDYAMKNQILTLLTDLKQQFALTYLFISHDIAAVNKICDRVVVMYLGNIVEIISNINGDVQHPYTKALLAATLIPDPQKREKKMVLYKDEEELKIPERGCVFQNRCLYTQEVCKAEQPSLVPKTGEHYIACHFYYNH